jgi:hypothetical protein
MKFLIVIFFSVINLSSAVRLDDRKFINYIDISFLEGINFEKGSSYGGGNINSSVGFLYDFNEKNSLALDYMLSYSGPYISYENRFLDERIMNHGAMLEYSGRAGKSLRIRPHIYFGSEYRKDSSIGDFKDNLYNNNTKGLGLAVDYYPGNDRTFTTYVIYRKIEFPNYTDLLYEFLNPGVATEIGGGLYDNNLYRFGAKLMNGKIFYSVDYTMQRYINQKVIKSDASYGNDKQRDDEAEFKIGIEHNISKFYFYPSVNYIIHSSNQNFLRFKSFTDVEPVFIGDAYDYKEIGFDVPSYFKFIGLDVNLSAGFKSRNYSKRPPRNTDNDYILSDDENDRMFSLSLSATRKINDLASFIFYYSFVKSTSNNKFEDYLPYNYSGHSLGIGYKISY